MSVPGTPTGARRFDGRWSITKPRRRNCCGVWRRTSLRVRGRCEGRKVVIRFHRRQSGTMAVAAAVVVMVVVVEAAVVVW